MADFTIGNTYNFKCYAPSILTSDFSNVVVTDILSYATASRFREVAAVHAQIYNQLPDGTPNQPQKYQYLQVQFPNGKTDIIGIPWIRSDTVQLVDSVIFDVQIQGLSSTDYNKISAALKQNGITNFTIKIL
jgi:hypothetical protein